MSAVMLGADQLRKALADVDRRVTSGRQQVLLEASRAVLVRRAKPKMRRSPGKAGPLLARYTVARKGKGGAVVVGPRGGKRAAWFRAFFIAGSRRHEIGGGQAAELRQYRRTSQLFYRNVRERAARFLYNPAATPPMVAMGPVTHPGFAENPAVAEAIEEGWDDFVAEVSKRLWHSQLPGRPRGGSIDWSQVRY